MKKMLVRFFCLLISSFVCLAHPPHNDFAQKIKNSAEYKALATAWREQYDQAINITLQKQKLQNPYAYRDQTLPSAVKKHVRKKYKIQQILASQEPFLVHDVVSQLQQNIKLHENTALQKYNRSLVLKTNEIAEKMRDMTVSHEASLEQTSIATDKTTQVSDLSSSTLSTFVKGSSVASSIETDDGRSIDSLRSRSNSFTTIQNSLSEMLEVRQRLAKGCALHKKSQQIYAQEQVLLEQQAVQKEKDTERKQQEKLQKKYDRIQQKQAIQNQLKPTKAVHKTSILKQEQESSVIQEQRCLKAQEVDFVKPEAEQARREIQRQQALKKKEIWQSEKDQIKFKQAEDEKILQQYIKENAQQKIHHIESQREQIRLSLVQAQREQERARAKKLLVELQTSINKQLCHNENNFAEKITSFVIESMQQGGFNHLDSHFIEAIASELIVQPVFVGVNKIFPSIKNKYPSLNQAVIKEIIESKNEKWYQLFTKVNESRQLSLTNEHIQYLVNLEQMVELAAFTLQYRDDKA